MTKLVYIDLPKLPRRVSGLKKDGTLDRRCKNGFAQLREMIEKASGVSRSAISVAKMKGLDKIIKS